MLLDDGELPFPSVFQGAFEYLSTCVVFGLVADFPFPPLLESSDPFEEDKDVLPVPFAQLRLPTDDKALACSRLDLLYSVAC